MHPDSPAAAPFSHATLATPPWAQGIYDLISLAKCKQAVEEAKTLHKQRNSSESEQVIVDAYLARIGQFLSKGSADDARTLIQVVDSRFPKHRHRLAGLSINAAASSGRIGELLTPLANTNTPQAVRTAIESAVRCRITDLRQISNCDILPAEHPLRTSAKALWNAFVAVTAGPVSDEQIALGAVSHRSPLAPWKMLIRAIAAFYRDDLAGCRQAISAIPADAACARLIPALAALCDNAEPPAGMAGILISSIRPNDKSLQAALASCEGALGSFQLGDLRRSIRSALSECANSAPDQLVELRSRLRLRCMHADVPMEEITALVGPLDADVRSLRAAAVAIEADYPEDAALLWHDFMTVAIREKMFAQDSLECAMVYLHVAELLGGRRPSDSQRGHSTWVDHNRGPDGKKRDELIVRWHGRNAEWLYEQAARIDPDLETFRKWWNWCEKFRKDSRTLEHVAEVWAKGRPTDVEPLIRLVTLAEERKAYKTAITRLDAAEALNPLHTEVRRARIRLTLSVLWRHAKQCKPHLVRQDLAALEAIQSMTEGDRALCVRAIRVCLGKLERKEDEYQRLLEEFRTHAGTAAIAIVMMVARMMGVDSGLDIPTPPDGPSQDPSCNAVMLMARLSRLSRDLSIPCLVPPSWMPMMHEVVRQNPCPVPLADILDFARFAHNAKQGELAYLTTAAGLRVANGAMAAQCLLTRGMCLPDWSLRTAQCLAAARELARQAHDTELLGRIAQEAYYSGADLKRFEDEPGRMSEARLTKILEVERNAVRWVSDPDDHVLPEVASMPPRQYFPVDEYDDEYDDDEYDDDSEDYDGDLVDVPRGAEALMADVMKRFGRIPPPPEMARKAPDLARRFIELSIQAKMPHMKSMDIRDMVDDLMAQMLRSR